MKKASLKPKPIEIISEGILKKLHNQNIYLKRLDLLIQQSIKNSRPNTKCEFRQTETLISTEHNKWKWTAITCAISFLIAIAIGLNIQLKQRDFEKYYYLYELRKQYDFSAEKAEKLYQEKEEFIKLKIKTNNI